MTEPVEGTVEEEETEYVPKYDREFDKKPLDQSIYEAIGAASACWETLEHAGVYQSEDALDIGRQLQLRIEREIQEACESVRTELEGLKKMQMPIEDPSDG